WQNVAMLGSSDEVEVEVEDESSPLMTLMNTDYFY
ncbi:MAG: hypothetical protein PWQ17_1941, partial [Anaerophaga sp.]|nr:hypothetical protein [Anaerophaga sp.]